MLIAMATFIAEMSKAEVLLTLQSRKRGVRQLHPTTIGCWFHWQYARPQQKDRQVEVVGG